MLSLLYISGFLLNAFAAYKGNPHDPCPRQSGDISPSDCALDINNENTITKRPAKQVCGYSYSESDLIDLSDERKFGEFPWMVAIANLADSRYNYKCGGSLIHPEVVLTAAHCVNKKGIFQVRAGEWEPTNKEEPYPHQIRGVKTITIHPDFKPGVLHNDLALLFLNTPMQITKHINVICLPKSMSSHNEKCVTFGWGKGLFNQIGLLKKQELNVVNARTCEMGLRDTPLGNSFQLHESFVCAGNDNYIAGAPLMCPIDSDRFYQAGIASWNIRAGGEVNSVFINVSHFKDWIDQQMNNNKFTISTY